MEFSFSVFFSFFCCSSCLIRYHSYPYCWFYPKKKKKAHEVSCFVPFNFLLASFILWRCKSHFDEIGFWSLCWLLVLTHLEVWAFCGSISTSLALMFCPLASLLYSFGRGPFFPVWPVWPMEFRNLFSSGLCSVRGNLLSPGYLNVSNVWGEMECGENV